MDPTKNITCPVCGRPNRRDDQCTFCGANLRGVASSPAEPPGHGPLPPSAGPGPQRTEGVGYPPSSPEADQRWEETVLTPKFAGFWIRTVAYLIDGFVILIVLTVLTGVGVFGYLSGSEKGAVDDVSSLFFNTNWNILNAVVFLLYMVYFTFFLGTRGQTPGKMICGLRVIRVDGRPVGFGQAALRTLGYYLNQLTLGIGFLWVAVDPRKQGLHDKIAGTLEIRVGPAEVRGWQPPIPRQEGSP